MADQNKAAGVNKHGLPRRIPEDVKREVRKRCGFGCIVCGCGFIQYEHLDPEFNDAKIHDPNCIVTLCPTCHGSVTSKFWSKQRIKKHALKPKCIQDGYLKHVFDFYADGHPEVKIGGALLRNCPVPVEAYGMPLIQIKPPEEKDGPFLFSGVFCDKSGAPTLNIVDNEWIAQSDSWDVEVSGGGIIIRNGPRDIVLKLSVVPPHTLSVDRLKMKYGGYDIDITGEKLVINNSTFTGCIADNCKIGFSLG